jgi:hypothetical protein
MAFPDILPIWQAAFRDIGEMAKILREAAPTIACTDDSAGARNRRILAKKNEKAFSQKEKKLQKLIAPGH